MFAKIDLFKFCRSANPDTHSTLRASKSKGLSRIKICYTPICVKNINRDERN